MVDKTLKMKRRCCSVFSFRSFLFLFGGWFYTVTVANQVAGTHCRSLMFDKPMGGYALQQHVFKQIYLSMGLEPHSDCKNRCLMENTCVSVNVGPPSKRGLRVCQLSDSDHIQHPDDLKLREGYQYWSTKNPCSSSPCLPNATCLNGFTDKRYICLCQVGSKGKQCGEKVGYNSLGCFNDGTPHALPLALKNFRGNIDWNDMTKIVRACAEIVKERGLSVFGIMFYGECWSGLDAENTYNKYGPSEDCWNGVGKEGAYHVYKI